MIQVCYKSSAKGLGLVGENIAMKTLGFEISLIIYILKKGGGVFSSKEVRDLSGQSIRLVSHEK